VSILYLLASEGLDEFAELGGRHVVMIRAVFGNYRPQRASTQAVDVLNGEEAIRGYLTRFNPELASSVVEEKV
jgi:hypothetical protein